MTDGFEIVGPRDMAFEVPVQKPKRRLGRTAFAAAVLAAIVLGCALSGLWLPGDPGEMDLLSAGLAPSAAHPFGTDTMGRDVFRMIWHGGRVSLGVGALATLISTLAAVAVGALSGMAPRWLDGMLMRLTEILMSVPSLLTVILIQAALGRTGAVGLSLAIGLTSWQSVAKVVRAEVRQMRACEYVVASKCMGGGFFHVLARHLAPNFLPSVMFMVVMNLRGAIVAESTLSFMGVGLPLETVSWGGMLSLAERAMTGGAWWIVAFPGLFLTVVLVCVTDLGNALRRSVGRGESKL